MGRIPQAEGKKAKPQLPRSKSSTWSTSSCREMMMNSCKDKSQCRLPKIMFKYKKLWHNMYFSAYGII